MINWFDYLPVQETLRSLLQHHNLKASILWYSVFFMVQLSHPYMITGKTIALTRLMSLLFNMLSRLVIAFLPRSRCLLISWLQSPSAVILESPQKSEVKIIYSYPTLWDPTECSPPGSSVCGILQAWILEWVAISFSRGSSQPRDRTRVSRIVGRCLIIWATREVSSKKLNTKKESINGQMNLHFFAMLDHFK